MNPGKDIFARSINDLGAANRRLNIVINAGDCLAFAPDIGDIPRVPGNDFSVLDQ